MCVLIRVNSLVAQSISLSFKYKDGWFVCSVPQMQDGEKKTASATTCSGFCLLEPLAEWNVTIDPFTVVSP